LGARFGVESIRVFRPVFNVADSAITAVYLLSWYFQQYFFVEETTKAAVGQQQQKQQKLCQNEEKLSFQQ